MTIRAIGINANLSDQINASGYKFLVLLRGFDLYRGWILPRFHGRFSEGNA